MSKVILQVSSSDGSSHAFVLTEHDTFLLGRMEDCHLCVPGDPQVSRHHFLLEACPPMASLRDLGSLNGTHVNGKKCGGREKGKPRSKGRFAKPCKLRDLLRNPIQHLDTTEEIWWLDRWKSPNNIKSSVNLKHGSTTDVDWTFTVGDGARARFN